MREPVNDDAAAFATLGARGKPTRSRRRRKIRAPMQVAAECLECGEYSPVGYGTCWKCGGALGTPEAVDLAALGEGELEGRPEPRSWRTRSRYIQLAGWFGVFGVHNFWAGRTAAGFTQLGILVAGLSSLGIGMHIDFYTYGFWLWLVGIALLVIPRWWVWSDIVHVEYDGDGMLFS